VPISPKAVKNTNGLLAETTSAKKVENNPRMSQKSKRVKNGGRTDIEDTC
jgi:hypothetical protein